MSIHQIQITYDPAADRLLWQVRTTDAQVFALWLTRRLSLRLWPHLRARVAQQSAPVSPKAVVTPQAREMLEQAARTAPLPHADFNAPFQSEGVQRPLGNEPMLVSEVNLGQGPNGGIVLQWRDAQGRHLTLQLEQELSLAVMRLMEAALQRADWGVPLASVPASKETLGGPGPLLS